jgi:plasmid stability protein
MKNLNLRGFPDDLYVALRHLAADRRTTLKAVVVAILQEAMGGARGSRRVPLGKT